MLLAPVLVLVQEPATARDLEQGLERELTSSWRLQEQGQGQVHPELSAAAPQVRVRVLGQAQPALERVPVQVLVRVRVRVQGLWQAWVPRPARPLPKTSEGESK